MGLLLVALLTSGLALGETQIQWPVKDSSFVGSWPSDSEWKGLHILDDLANDVTGNGHLNFVGDTKNPGFYIAKKTVSGTPYLFFRIRVNYSGTVTEPTCTTLTPPAAPTGCNQASPFSGGTILLYIQSGNGTKPEYAALLELSEYKFSLKTECCR
ncbi:MAG TPA: hypothetical protein P5326_09985, partial [Candidatus Contendobacter sp.]|nr:hypothetical protein [Candidatus Contendobacter sp.]